MTLREKYIQLRIINLVLTWVIYFICALVIIFPYVPEVTYALRAKETSSISVESATYVGGPNRLLIPKIAVEETIIETDSITEVHDNVWRRPNGARPGENGNTILIAHRYASIDGYRSSTFYHLPKLAPGDTFQIVWDGYSYTYEVYGTETVPSTELSIEAPTATPEVTLYTCTPLWTSKERFVVHARPI